MANDPNTFLESDGKSVDVTLSYTVTANRVALVQDWIGITNDAGDSDDVISLNIDEREYQVKLPDSINPSVGDILYVTLASVSSSHVIPDAAWSLSSGSGKRGVFKVTKTRFGSSGAYYVKAKMLPQMPVSV